MASDRRSGRCRLSDPPHDGTRREPLPVGHADTPYRAARRSVSGTEGGDTPATRREIRHRRRRLGRGHEPSLIAEGPGHGGQDHQARHRVHSVPLGRPAKRQPPDAPHAGSTKQDPGVQSVRVPHREDAGPMSDYGFYIDPSRCIGCRSGEDGVVRSALKPRCIACSNCVLACPFGVPTVHVAPELMMKCDMCYDRTSTGLRPMCATVCPSQALMYGPAEAIARNRAAVPVNAFKFGNEVVRTKVFMMMPADEPLVDVDVEDYMWKESDESPGWIVEPAVVD